MQIKNIAILFACLAAAVQAAAVDRSATFQKSLADDLEKRTDTVTSPDVESALVVLEARQDIEAPWNSIEWGQEASKQALGAAACTNLLIAVGQDITNYLNKKLINVEWEMREAVVALGVIWKFTPVSTWCAKPQVAVGATVGMVVYKYLSAWVKSLQEGKDVPQRRSLLSIEGSETDSLDLLSFDIEPHLAQLERRADRSAMIAVAQTILKNMGQRFGQGGWEACKDSNRGYMKCLNNNVFVTCDYGAWIPRKCGDGTRCQKSNENWVTCGW